MFCAHGVQITRDVSSVARSSDSTGVRVARPDITSKQDSPSCKRKNTAACISIRFRSGLHRPIPVLRLIVNIRCRWRSKRVTLQGTHASWMHRVAHQKFYSTMRASERTLRLRGDKRRAHALRAKVLARIAGFPAKLLSVIWPTSRQLH